MWRRARRAVFLLAALVFAAPLAAAPVAPVTIGLATAPATLDPRYASDATSERLCRLVYEALVGFDAQFRPVPALARWESGDDRVWHFHLAPGHRFHDGTPLDAGDVVATYGAVLDPALASPLRGPLAGISAVRALDPATIEFELARPDPLFPGQLTIGILKRDAAASRAPAAPLGSGAFAVVGSPDSRGVVLERRRDGARFRFEVVPNETVRALKLAHGELDLVQGGLTPETAAWLASQPGVTVNNVPGTTFTYLGLNLAGGPTARPEVRRAIAQAIDRRALVELVWHGGARLAETLLVPEHWASGAGGPALAYDPEAARRTLAALGYDRAHPLALTYKTSSDGFRLRLAQLVQASLADVGIAITIQSYDWGTFYGDVKAGRFELYSLSWVGLKLPDAYRHVFHSSARPPAGANRGAYASPRADALIEAAEREPDLAKRGPTYAELQRVLAADLPIVPLWYEDTVVARGARITRYRTDADGSYDGLADLVRSVHD